jgi:hypothetical protein
MEFSVHGDGDPLLCVLGWGNHPGQANVAWLLDELAAAGFEVHAATIPTNASDFEAAFVEPLESYAADREFDAVLSHSTGGLAVAHLDWDVRRVYLSPWWGLQPGVQALVLPWFAKLPTDRPVLPAGDASVGDIEEPEPREDHGLSPAFVREVVWAQRSLPEFRAGSTVFCTLTDELVSVPAIGERTPARNLRVYDGGHECFSSTGRETVLADVVAALRGGPNAVSGPTA